MHPGPFSLLSQLPSLDLPAREETLTDKTPDVPGLLQSTGSTRTDSTRDSPDEGRIPAPPLSSQAIPTFRQGEAAGVLG
jgi:hypothetical protein